MSGKIDVPILVMRFITLAILFFLFFPILITIVVSFSTSGFMLPPKGLTLRWYETALTSKEFLSGMYVSLIIGILSSLIATTLGVMIAYALCRYRFRGREFINMFFMSPLLLPAAIMGLALYSFLVKLGAGEGFTALIIGHTVLIIPFAIRVIMASLQNVDLSLEEAAMNVGAGSLRTFFSITLPIIRTGIIAGMMMCFIISWNNFALSVFLASPNWVPLPIQVYSYIKFQYDPSGAALVSTIIFMSAFVIVVLDKIVGIGTVMGIQNKA